MRALKWDRPMRFGAVLLASIFSLQRPVAAQSPATAQELFERGRILLQEGRYGEACPLFAESQNIDPAGGTLLNLALCYEQVGRTATSHALYVEALELATSEGRTDRIAFAQQRLQVLGPALSTLTIEPTDPDPRLVIRVDGRDVARAEWGEPRPYDPGEHVITAQLPAYVDWTSRVQLEDHGDSMRITVPSLTAISIPAGEPVIVVEAPPPSAPEPDRIQHENNTSATRGPVRLMGFGSLGWLGGSLLESTEQAAYGAWLGGELSYEFQPSISLGVATKRLMDGRCAGGIDSCQLEASDVGLSARFYIQRRKRSSWYYDAWLGAIAGLGNYRFVQRGVQVLEQRDVDTDVTHRGSVLSLGGGYDLGGSTLGVSLIMDLSWFRSTSAEGHHVVDGKSYGVEELEGKSLIAYSAGLGFNLYL
jgi:tetratricopeptide (TPR) repeat protein